MIRALDSPISAFLILVSFSSEFSPLNCVVMMVLNIGGSLSSPILRSSVVRSSAICMSTLSRSKLATLNGAGFALSTSRYWMGVAIKTLLLALIASLGSEEVVVCVRALFRWMAFSYLSPLYKSTTSMTSLQKVRRSFRNPSISVHLMPL
jgi:hypothetical protein